LGRRGADCQNDRVLATRTVLFSDLRDYTQFVQRHGDAAAKQLISDYHRIVRAEIAKHEGAEIKTEGDSFYVVFPGAHAAVSAASAILREADRYSQRQPQRPLRIGVGIHAGEPQPHEGQYVGSAVIVAARLAQSAGAGDLLISDLVRGLLPRDGMPAMEERTGLVLKGLDDPPRAYAVRWPREAPAAMSIPAAEPGSRQVLCPEVVGRDRELASLTGFLAEARAGRGRTVLLAGKAGLGKSGCSGASARSCGPTGRACSRASARRSRRVGRSGRSSTRSWAPGSRCRRSSARAGPARSRSPRSSATGSMQRSLGVPVRVQAHRDHHLLEPGRMPDPWSARPAPLGHERWQAAALVRGLPAEQARPNAAAEREGRVHSLLAPEAQQPRSLAHDVELATALPVTRWLPPRVARKRKPDPFLVRVRQPTAVRIAAMTVRREDLVGHHAPPSSLPWNEDRSDPPSHRSRSLRNRRELHLGFGLMKVVHVATSDMSLRYLLLDQLVYLRSLGYDVSGVSGPGPWLNDVRTAGVPVDVVPLSRAIEPLRDLRAFVALVVHFLRTRPDVVHTHTPKASLLGQWAAFVARVPKRVHTIHGLYFPGHMRPERRWFYVLLERLQMRPAHAILSQNREDLETCRRDRICDISRLTYLGNGIDIERFHPRNRARRASIRQALGIADDRLVVGMVGRVVREKGYLEYFEAAARVRVAHPNAVFLAIGPYEPWKADAIAVDEIAAFGLGAALRLLGHRDDVEHLYAAMDLVTLPSHREGFPRSPMEAAATGLPVVVTDVRGCRETVIDGVTGHLVPARDPEQLATVIAALLADHAARARMGERGRRLAEERFDQGLVFERVAKAYEAL